MLSKRRRHSLRKTLRRSTCEPRVHFRVGREGSTTEYIKQMIVQVSREFSDDSEEVNGDHWSQSPGEKRKPCKEWNVGRISLINSHQAADTLDDFLSNIKLPVFPIMYRTQVERETAM